MGTLLKRPYKKLQDKIEGRRRAGIVGRMKKAETLGAVRSIEDKGRIVFYQYISIRPFCTSLTLKKHIPPFHNGEHRLTLTWETGVFPPTSVCFILIYSAPLEKRAPCLICPKTRCMISS